MRTIRLLIALLALFAAAPALAADRAASPAMWRIADQDTTIWLLGTIHILPEGFNWRNAEIDAAIAGSDELVLETVFDDDAELASALLELGVDEDLPPLDQRVPAELRGELAAMIARSPFPKTLLNTLETWAAGMVLMGVTLDDLGVAPGSGVEDQLEREFAAADAVAGLESPAEQLGYFDALPEAAQRDFLAGIVETPADVRAEFDAMLDAWVRGDEAAIAATFDDDLQFSETLRQVLLVRRNAAWARWIAERLDRPGTVLMAVGAGHLVGRDSVQELLEAEGIGAERVQ